MSRDTPPQAPTPAQVPRGAAWALRYVSASGVLVLAAIVAMFHAVAFLRGGHPPASGIVVVLLAAAVTPLSLLALALGTLQSRAGRATARHHLMLGVHFAFVFIVACAIVYKGLLGARL